MSYELCIGYKEDDNSMFNEFTDARNNLYTCLKVNIKKSTNNVYLLQNELYCRTTSLENFQ